MTGRRGKSGGGKRKSPVIRDKVDSGRDKRDSVGRDSGRINSRNPGTVIDPRTDVDVRPLPRLKDAQRNPNLLPQHIRALTERIREDRAGIITKLSILREGLKEFFPLWLRERARLVAVAQEDHTIRMGRDGIGKMKRMVEDHIKTFADAIDEEFSVENYGDADCSSGQVAGVMKRRFEHGMRTILSDANRIFRAAGYKKDDTFLEPELPDPTGDRPSAPLELPPDIEDLIQEIDDRIVDIKVLEAKIIYFDREREKVIAAELWDDV
jgi:hypothetical protein